MQGYEVVNFDSLPKAPEGENLTEKDVAKVVPYKRLNNEDDTSTIGNKILDQSVYRFLQSDYVQQSSLGKTAKNVEEGVRTDVTFGD